MSSSPEAAASVQGDVVCHVNYRTDNGELQSDADLDTNSWIRPMPVRLMNARSRGHFTLGQHGFALLDHETGMVRADYFDDRRVTSMYYPLCEEAIKHATGAAAVKCFHHAVRGHAGRPFACVAHADYSTVAAHKVLQTVRPEGLSTPFKGRICILNLWRNINEASPIQNDHLAVCDGSSVVAPDDFVPYRAADDSTGEAVRVFHLSPNHHRAHRWYYFPMMAAGEALAFTQYDSDPRRPCRYTFHSSVSVPDGTARYRRESIEVRCVAWFPDAEHNTLPDLSLPADVVVPAAVASTKEQHAHLEHWDETGRMHLMDHVLAGRWVEWVTTHCKYHRTDGTNAAFHLSDAQIGEVARTLEKDSDWTTLMLDACRSWDSGKSVVSQCADRLIECTKNVCNMDEKGKAFAKDCSENGKIAWFLTALSEDMMSRGLYPWNDFKQGDMEAVIAECKKRGVDRVLRDAVAKI